MNLPFRVIDTRTGKIAKLNPSYATDVPILTATGELYWWIEQSETVVMPMNKSNVSQYQAGSFTDKGGNQLWENDLCDCVAFGRRKVVWSGDDAAFMLEYRGDDPLCHGGKAIPLRSMNPTGITRVGNTLLDKPGKKGEL